MYRAPVSEIAFTLKHVAGMKEALDNGLLGDLTEDLVDAILEEAGKFASEEVAPLNRVGDEEKAKRNDDGSVVMPTGFRDIYRQWAAAGWNGLTGPQDYGGQGLTTSLSMATQDMFNGASMAFMLGPCLTIGAIEAMEKHASDELKATFLEKLVTGEWTGTMNLTEPQAGSDLAALKTRAERQGDGTYRIFGQKIYITYGEHDMTDNIVHMVLARLPDAPAGTKGISLFLVPKFLVEDDGSLGARNDVFCNGIEHKMGLHASPTCTLIYGDGKHGETAGAIGYLVGEENRGLACMFTMMNNARLAVGIQGIGVGERAYQQALAFARERRQGKAPGSSSAPGEMDPIIQHPDIKRSLLAMRGLLAASRAISYDCAHSIDMARRANGEAKAWQERANLLTPVAKAFSTDAGTEVADIGIQIHGGMGYVEETGAAQHLRDARIAQIYEGTNGIQAIDLVTRKLPQSGGETVRGYIAELKAVAEEARRSNRADFGRLGERASASLDDLDTATEHLLAALSNGRAAEALAVATPYLRLFGLASGAAYMAKAALATARHANGAASDRARIVTARFFAESLAPETRGLCERITAGDDAALEADEALLTS